MKIAKKMHLQQTIVRESRCKMYISIILLLIKEKDESPKT